MTVGPIFRREAMAMPQNARHFLIRSGYVAALFVLMYTAGQATFGWQQVRNVGDIARFGTLIFQVFSFIQLTMVIFFGLLFSAGRVAQEKDRETLILLLMTDLRNREMVLGKLCSSLLLVAVLLAASAPVFVMVHLMGGVSLQQIGWVLAICAAAGVAAGSWGTLVAFWREKTFQTLAVSVLGFVLIVGAGEAIAHLLGPWLSIAEAFRLIDPYRGLLSILNPLSDPDVKVPVVSALDSVLVLGGAAVVLNGITINRLRVWNPSRATFMAAAAGGDNEGKTTVKSRSRKIWSNPVIWREICTRAYGRKVFLIKVAYFAIAAYVTWSLIQTSASDAVILGMISRQGFSFVILGLLSLMLVNAQAVTALTSERDGKTLELLLVTDITAKEFIYGKLGGVLYNSKELVIMPLLLAGYVAWTGTLTWENFAYLSIGYLVLVVFAAMLGLHSGLCFDNSRTSIGNSLGTMFFLFIGIFIFMLLLVEARSSFLLQLPSFMVFIIVGGIGLIASLTHKNPSPALMLAGGMLPFLTFYAITEFLLDGTLGVCFSVSVAYGFTTAAMLIPAVSEFDVALGRTSRDQG